MMATGSIPTTPAYRVVSLPSDFSGTESTFELALLYKGGDLLGPQSSALLTIMGSPPFILVQQPPPLPLQVPLRSVSSHEAIIGYSLKQGWALPAVPCKRSS